jgi:glycosyltransferase involved in cell wall biosynthesis
MQPVTYSLVIPIYNEQESIPLLADAITGLMGEMDGPAEVILVNDGSADRSLELMLQLHEKDSRFKIVSLSRNFGHQMAVSAGIDFASGDAVIIMDADLQDPPAVVHAMIEKWKEGFEVVYAVRKSRKGETRFKRLTAAVFYRIFRRLTNMKIPADVGDFRLVDRKAITAFRKLKEHNRYVRGLFSWIGFRQIGIEYVRNERRGGETKYPLHKMVKFAMDGVLSFSDAPLQLALRLGFLISGLSLTGCIVVFAKKIIEPSSSVAGWTSLLLAVALLGGIQLTVMGFIGLYVSRIHDEVRGRPIYLTNATYGFDPEPTVRPSGTPKP